MSEAEETQLKIQGNEMRDDNQKIKASASKSSIVKKIIGDDDKVDDNLSLSALHSNKKKPVSDSKAKTNVKVTKVKKEEIYDSKDEMAKVRSKANVKVSKVKKEEKYDLEEEMDDKKLVQKVEKKSKKVKKEVNIKTKVSREKKVYSLPGQKHEPPQERDPLRIFYESLHQQMPTSEMAAIWMMEWGLLSESEAEKVYKKKISKNESLKLKSPSTTVVSAKKTAKVTVQEVKKTPTTKTAKVTVQEVKETAKVTVQEVKKTPTTKTAKATVQGVKETTKVTVQEVKKTAKATVQEVKKTPTTKFSSKTPKKRKAADPEDDGDDDFVQEVKKTAAAKTNAKTPKKRRVTMDSEDDGDDDFVISDAKKKNKEEACSA